MRKKSGGTVNHKPPPYWFSRWTKPGKTQARCWGARRNNALRGSASHFDQITRFLSSTSSPRFFSRRESVSQRFWPWANDAKPSGCFSINIICCGDRGEVAMPHGARIAENVHIQNCQAGFTTNASYSQIWKSKKGERARLFADWRHMVYVGVIMTYCIYYRQQSVMKHPTSAVAEALNCISRLKGRV